MIQHTWVDRVLARLKKLSPAQKLARAARGAVPLVPTHVEAMEPRRLMAVTFTFDINDPGGTFEAFYDDVTRTLEAAGDAWGENFTTTVTIQTEVRFINGGFGGFLASAGPVHFEPIRTAVVDGQNIEILEEGPAHEIRTGVDPNQSQHDAIVNINIQQLGEFFFDPDPDKRDAPVPTDEYDAYSILLHEIGHMIGFFGLKDDFDGDIVYVNPDTGNLAMTLWDELTERQFGQFVFTGENAVDIYGEPLPLSQGSLSHYGNRFGPGEDLAELLMAPDIARGQQDFIELIDLAILADLGLPMTQDFEPVTPPVLTVTGTNRDDVIEVINTGAVYIVKVNRFSQEYAIFDEFGDANFTDFVINAGGGDDSITLSANMPGVIINGEDGRDSITGGGSNDTITGGASGDLVHGGGGRDRIDGGGGHDRLFGDDGDDRLVGGNDNDTLEGGNGHDSLFGNNGNDSLFGNNGNDTIYGQDGDDLLNGLNNDDQMNGGSGADQFRGGTGFDFVDYEDASGNLIISLDEKANDGTLGEGDNLFSGIETVRGGAFNDYIVGDGRNNQITGGLGNDTILGGSGDDELIGGSGSDRLYGTSGNDTLNGGGGSDMVFGGSGTDQLFGGNGNDRLFAIDRETDTLFGGPGNDTAEFNDLDNLTEIEIEVPGEN